MVKNSPTIDAVLIMNRSGLPLMFQKLNPKTSDIDPVLLSGFLEALTTFSTEFIEKSGGDFQINYGYRTLTIQSGKNVKIVAIHQEQGDNETPLLFQSLLDEFEQRYCSNCNDKHCQIVDESKYADFKEVIIKTVGLTIPSMEWVPCILNRQHVTKSRVNMALLSVINGEMSLRQILEKIELDDGISREKAMEAIMELWMEKVIYFKGVLDEKDILILSQNFSFESDDVRTSRGLIRVLSYLDGKKTVKEILNQFPEKERDMILRQLEHALAVGAVKILSPEKRRLLMIKSLLDKTLTMASMEIGKDTVIKHLEECLAQVENQEILVDLQVAGKFWKINYDFHQYEKMNPKDILDSCRAWLTFLKQFLEMIKEKKRKKIIENLMNSFYLDFLDKYHSEDMSELEDFAFWLEENHMS